MKKLISLFFSLMLTVAAFADRNTMNYQAVITDADGKPVADKNIGLQFKIVATANSLLFEEEVVVKSDASGLVNYEIGSSTESGLKYVNWYAAEIALQVGIDVKGGNDYSTVYSSSIQSVPMAFQAQRSMDAEELREDVEKAKSELYYITEDLDQKVKRLHEDVDYSFMEYQERMNVEIANLIDRQSTSENMIKDVQHLLDVQINSLQNYISEIYTNMDDIHAKVETLQAITDAKLNENEIRIKELEQMVSYLMSKVDELSSK